MTIFGDAEAAVVDILTAADSLENVNVATDLIGYSTGRWLRVVRTGGTPTMWMRVDNPVIEIAAYAADKGDALDLARAARAVVYAARGQYVGCGLALYDVTDDQGLSWSPDERNPALARYLFTLALVTKPAA